MAASIPLSAEGKALFLAASEATDLASIGLAIGQKVVNFGHEAVVVGAHYSAGNGRFTGLVILEADGIGRWGANPKLCSAA